MIQECEEFRLIFQYPLTVISSDLRFKRFQCKHVNKLFNIGLVFAQITSPEPDAINCRNDRSN